MFAYFLSVGNRRHTRRVGFRMIFWLALTCVPLFPTQVIPKKATATRRATVREMAAYIPMSPPPKYNCFGKQVDSENGQENLERAIDDALKILEGCKSCQQMFDRKNPHYAVDLLQRLRRDKVFVISSVMPDTFLIGRDKTLRVTSVRKLDKAAAASLDLDL